MYRRIQPICFLGLLLTTLATSACSDPPSKDPLPSPVERSRTLVERELPTIDQRLDAAAFDRAVKAALQSFIEAEAARPFPQRVQSGLRYMTVFEREYLSGNLRPGLATPAGLNLRGQTVLSILEDAYKHGIDNAEFQIDTIRALDHDIRTRSLPSRESFRLTPPEVEALVVLLASYPAEDQDDIQLLETALTQARTIQDTDHPLDRLSRHFHAREEAYRHLATQVAHLELFTADGTLRYARELGHKNLNRLDWRDLRDAGGSTEVILSRMQTTLRELLALPEDRAEEAFLAIEPGHHQYRALLTATDRYRQITATGGWPRVPSFNLHEGQRHRHAPLLRQRLQIEGFDAFPPAFLPDSAKHTPLATDERTDLHETTAFDPEHIDDSLINAIKAYQRTHQMDVTGRPTPAFWRSLNTSAEDRLRQMELTLQRWRESYLQNDREFIMVNIPDFHLEVWRHGDRQMRFPVVVGRSNRVCNPDTNTWTYPNATPVMMSSMDHIIINPSWYLPPRLVRESLEPKLKDNPNYFQEAGYEYVTMADGRKLIRQLPGPDNALGQAKFMFPSNDNIYLHDTPQKHFFSETLRAFSFGCVRLSEPLQLAQYLLDREDHHGLSLPEMLNDRRTFKVDIHNDLPVFIEYYTVWIDDDGLPNFLADPYRHDRRRLSDDPDAFDHCSPPRAPSPRDDPPPDEDLPEALDHNLGP